MLKRKTWNYKNSNRYWWRIKLKYSNKKEIDGEFHYMAKTRNPDDVHYVWRDFLEQFGELKYPTKFKYCGYEFMQKAEKWAEKFPNDVIVTTCDDYFFSSSIMVLILHKNGKERNYGTTVVVIPQHDHPLQFFLYEENSKQLKQALDKILKLKVL